jgi:small subunit ribosomal protein S20
MAKEAAKKVKRPNAQKRELQNKKNRMINKSFKSQVRTAIRQFDEELVNKDQKIIQNSLNNIYSLVDKGVKKGIYKANTASRTKSRLAARAMSSK